jgi:hypothetical protein
MSVKRVSIVLIAAAVAALVVAGCGNQRKPVIPRPAYTQRVAERFVFAGEDTTRVTLSYADFVGAPSPQALDSLRRAVNDFILAAPLDDPTPARPDTNAVFAEFFDAWSTFRNESNSSTPWYLEREARVAGDTLGVITLRMTTSSYAGGAHPNSSVSLEVYEILTGRRLAFGDLFRESARDSLSEVLEPLFRAARGMAPDSSLADAGFWFEGGKFRVNDNVGVGESGVTFFFNSYEVAAYAAGPTEIVAPFELVWPFARDGSPLAGTSKHRR